LNEPIPLIFTSAASPGRPLFLEINTPETFPCKALSMSDVGVLFNSDALIDETAPVKSLFFTVP